LQGSWQLDHISSHSNGKVPAGIPILSVFSGAGGLDLGFEQAGFLPLLAIDIAPAAVRTYQRNHPQARVVQLDLLKASPHEIITLWDEWCSYPPLGIVGGPPCQAFSVSNVHQKDGDPRGLLVTRYAGLITTLAQEKGTLFFVFENVPGLLRGRHRIRFLEFCDTCQEAGFRLYWKILDAARFGVPQYRRRLFIVGIHERASTAPFDLPEGDCEPPTVRDAIGHLPEPWYYMRGLNPIQNPVHPNHWTMQPRSRKFGSHVLVPGEMPGRSFRMLDWDKPSWTVAYGHREVHVHPRGHRRLSVYEAMLLQGFPPGYILEGTLSQQITLVSDAVPPPVARAIASALASWLGQHGILAPRPAGSTVIHGTVQ
jgi:DNA (cytosine-5)-methyltransferase 1